MYTITKLGQMVFERSQLGTQYKIKQYAVESSQLGYTMIKLGHMVLKGVNWLHNNKIRLNCLERCN